MVDDAHMEVDGGASEAETGGSSGAGAGAGDQRQPQQQQRELINSLEVDSDRADNDSSLGSDISSCVHNRRAGAGT